jgi:N-glycosidase YbiA
MSFQEGDKNIRIYLVENSCIFRTNAGEFGGLSNMSVKYPVVVNGIKIRSVEALYQACKFPNDPDLQQRILSERSPFTAKMITKGKETRNDWMQIRVAIMKWCLEIKLAQNYYAFGELLRCTSNKDIVEYSRTDIFWGANKIDDNQLRGINALGRLLMQLREHYLTKPKNELLTIKSPNILNFNLLGDPILPIDMGHKYNM